MMEVTNSVFSRKLDVLNESSHGRCFAQISSHCRISLNERAVARNISSKYLIKIGQIMKDRLPHDRVSERSKTKISARLHNTVILVLQTSYL
jgi:hypothetical protein